MVVTIRLSFKVSSEPEQWDTGRHTCILSWKSFGFLESAGKSAGLVGGHGGRVVEA